MRQCSSVCGSASVCGGVQEGGCCATYITVHYHHQSARRSRVVQEGGLPRRMDIASEVVQKEEDSCSIICSDY
jgi:hypothetical protein